jgi:hypothetical protein
MADKIYVARLGIGLLPPRHDEISGFGHTWLYWKTPEKEHHPPFRGYYPVEEEIPIEYRDYSKWPRFFARHCVRGRYQIDLFAMSIMEELDEDKFYTREWPITKKQLVRLRRRCFTPKDERHVIEGYYSWNRRHSEWHNCSSWVISVVNYVMNNANFLVCSSPKSLSKVELEIWKNKNQEET